MSRNRAGWSAWLAAAVGGFLLVAGLSGLWIWLAPFSVASQLVVLLHAGLGLAVAHLMAAFRRRRPSMPEP